MWGGCLSARGSRTVIAVPARDEAERIETCLSALLDQRGLDGAPLRPDAIRVLVFANNCSDATAEIARRSGDRIEVVEAVLPSANAGVARRGAMDAAVARLPEGAAGLICTTDADSRARPDWIARLWRAVDQGAEAVAGAVDFEPAEAASFAFSEARYNESLYSALQAEIVACVDPQAHNPWPNHLWAWGANLAVTASAYRRVGGMPPEPLAEDRAFVERLRHHDVPVRHCLDARVWTSGRRVGRAAGGLASLVDDHLGADEALCDAALEPAHLAWRRAAWRRRLRQVHAGHATSETLAARLKVAPESLRQALSEATFGAAWGRVETASPTLASQRLSPGDLPREIARAERLLTLITAGGRVDPADRARVAGAGLWSASAPPP